jgi:hypothetical protein
MKSALRKYEMEGSDMPANENDSLGELRADVRHIQADVTDIKADLRVTNQKIESLRKETGEQISKLDQKFDQKFESFRKETTEGFTNVDQVISEIKESLASAKIWALGLYVGLAGTLFYVLARGFKWL